MVGALLVAYLATRFTVAAGFTFSPAGLALVLATVGFALVGFVDDFLKIRRRRSLGLEGAEVHRHRARVDPVRVRRGRVLRGDGDVDQHLVRATERAGARTPSSSSWAFVVLTSSSNAVNLTDGLDGLAAGSSILLAGYLFIAFWQFRHTCDVLEVAGLGRRLLRRRPAGDAGHGDHRGGDDGRGGGFLLVERGTGTDLHGRHRRAGAGRLFGALAITTNTQLLLVILGGLYVIETMSVILQVISFRGFGRRIFRMSPIHHHFELAGWPEFTVIVRFWIIAGLCVAVGLGVFYADFIARGGLG